MSEMRFQWDLANAHGNLRKHGVDFAYAVGAFEDSRALTIPDPHGGEERFLTMGMDLTERLLVVSWAWRGDDIRVISARRAAPRERRQYHEEG